MTENEFLRIDELGARTREVMGSAAPYQLDEMLSAVADNPDGVLLSDGGVCAFTNDIDESLVSVYVSRNMRGRGVGSLLVNSALNEMRQRGIRFALCDFEQEDSPRRFARSMGFEPFFMSDFMTAPTCERDENHSIIPYRDEYYDAVSHLNHAAFMSMRQTVGLPTYELTDREEERGRYLLKTADCFVLSDKGKIAGAVKLSKGVIASLAVNPDSWGRGYGAELLLFALGELYKRGYSRAELWCVVGNPAVRLYERYGFVRIRRHEYMQMRL